ncbi:MAG: class I SAM-dependent methyltransferase, partial [Chloroflexota bacterium]
EVGRAEWAASRPDVQLLPIAIPSDAFLALDRFGFDSITCLNVLEHVQDDAAALRQMHHVLAPGGRLFLLVPANPWLYGSMDAADQHCRRYTRRGLAQAVAGAGFTVRSVRFMNALGVAGWFVNGRILRRALIPSAQAGLFDRCVPFIERLEAAHPPPVGQSLVLVADR